MKLWIFNWPSHVGGADTKVVHLLMLLKGHFDITFVPVSDSQYRDESWRAWISAHGASACLVDDLPAKCEGWALSLCNGAFFGQAMHVVAIQRGMKIIWSNEMMWNFPSELGAVCLGRVHTVLYTSEVQRRVLEPGYRMALMSTDPPAAPGATHGIIQAGDCAQRLRWVTTGNYVAPDAFPFRPRPPKGEGDPFVVGRVSRPDPDKFPPDFPASYEGLGLRGAVRFRVLGWSAQMASLWPEHTFDERWDLLPVASVPVVDFLGTLDVFVYEVGPRFSESWGRAVVEAMLSGVVPIVPADERHHLRDLVPHGVAGFHCRTREDYGRYAKLLQQDSGLLQRMGAAARHHAEAVLCNANEHLEVWKRVFDPTWGAGEEPS